MKNIRKNKQLMNEGVMFVINVGTGVLISYSLVSPKTMIAIGTTIIDAAKKY